MRDKWAHDLVNSFFGLLPRWAWVIVAVLTVVLLIVHQYRAARRDREMRELIAQGNSKLSLSEKKRLKHPQMHGQYGEFVKEPKDDAWKPRG